MDALNRTPYGAVPDLQPAEILRKLISFDTSNPPGNEAACIGYIQDLLSQAGIETDCYGRDPARPNLIARLRGRGDVPPLLMQGHVDVVPITGQVWTHPPFAAELVDGWIWGRGALDMKGGVAMMIAALRRARAENLQPPGDVVFAALADEEKMSPYGARYLVEEHPDLFAGIRYAVGEFGGFTLHVGGRKIYPIMIAEKRRTLQRVTFRGSPVYGAFSEPDSAMAKLGRALLAVEQRHLPVHVTTPTRLMFEGMAAALPFPQSLLLRLLLVPRLTDRLLKLAGPLGQVFDPLLHNSPRPRIRGREGFEASPDWAELELLTPVLPGCSDEELLAELRGLFGPGIELEMTESEPVTPATDMGMFGVLSGILHEADPDGTAVPYMLPAFSDGRFFARLGIQTYGFTPIRLPPGFEFWRHIHEPDERIPADAVRFGADALFRLIQRFGEAK